MGALAILSPHLDDAVFSCWHLLASSRDVRVVNVCTAVPPPGGPIPPWDRMTGATGSAARMRERLEEDERALALAERRAEHLGFLDSQYRDGSPGDVLGALRDRLSDEEILAPAGIGGHSDHELVRDAALELGRKVSLFGDLPYSTQWGWPAWMTGEEPDPLRDVDAYWAQFVPEGYEPHPVELGEEEQQAKVEAMRAYATQFSIFEAGALQRLTDPQLLRFEVVWTRRGLE